MDLAAEIRRIAEEKLAPAHFIIEVLVSVKKIPNKIMVIADGDQGFNIDDCAELSRQLAKYLDDHTNLIDSNYLLEVSTPGLDHPLKLKRQYYKNIGRGLKVKLKDRIEEGKLTEVTDEKITLLQETGTGKKKETKVTEIALSEIEKALVQVSFK
jgi:ribosome maturation factor RimP